MVKLLLVAPTCNGEDIGEAYIAHQWAQNLAQRHDVTLLTYHKRGATPAAQQLKNIRIVEWSEPPVLGRAERLNSILKPGYLPFYFRARRWIRQALASGNHFDIIHQPVPVAMRYPSPAANMGLPLVVGPVGGGLPSPPGLDSDDSSSPWYLTLRNLDQYRLRWDPLLRRTFESADCVPGIGEYVRELLSAVHLHRFEVMSDNALDELPPIVARKIRPESTKLLYVGRLIRTKGARDIIRAVALVKDLPIELDLVGDGPDRSECENLIAEHALEDRIKLHSWKSKSDVSEYYRKADIFVFPSYREPGGRVVLEAMSYSLPLIVVDRGGPSSATSDACAIKLSITTREKLAVDLAEAIRKLAANRRLRLQMGIAALEHVTRTALWPARLERMDAIYADVIAARAQKLAIPTQGDHYRPQGH
ncbi:glycosyltransferase family 4 protein [Ferirhizobium litorale]|uniref:Glycosyltransferase family 4 protein n=1 Tax=Ferirhizobium litorale TaxID=2927786 RepID=A0AAE3QBE8_9HYPH|nr:glycosyltransferase family 4 protein [Fererhizobium litorale]MDI7920888.1 glycosyltransferase family 4 protein [Fererhizobium litorale]